MGKLSQFQMPCYQKVVTNIARMVAEQTFNNIMVFKSGRAAGKSHQAFDNIVFWLPFFPNDDALVIVYSNRHKVSTERLIRTKLLAHGYGDKYTQKTSKDGDTIFLFGNNNSISVVSVSGKSKEEELDKLKAAVNYNYENGGRVRFMVVEEATAVANIFEKVEDFVNAISSFGRLYPDDERYIEMYIFNPPSNDMHIIYKWLDFILVNNPLMITTTILDLPEAYRSKKDLQIMDTYRKLGNQKAIDHYYLGIPSMRAGLAFEFNYQWRIKSAEQFKFAEYHIGVDNGTKDATTFTIFGITTENDVVILYNYYHSGRATGNLTAYSDYAQDLKDLVDAFEKRDILGRTKTPIKEIVTDSIGFTTECNKIGLKTKFIDKNESNNATFRELAYDFSDELIRQKRVYVIDRKENYMIIQQLLNAKLDLKARFPRIKKVANGSVEEEQQIHTVDTFTYFVYVHSELLLGRKEVILYA